MRSRAWRGLLFADVAGYGHGKDEFGAGGELNAVAVGRDLVAAFGAGRGLELEVFHSDDDAGMDGVGWAPGIEVFIELISTVKSLA